MKLWQCTEEDRHRSFEQVLGSDLHNFHANRSRGYSSTGFRGRFISEYLSGVHHVRTPLTIYNPRNSKRASINCHAASFMVNEYKAHAATVSVDVPNPKLSPSPPPLFNQLLAIEVLPKSSGSNMSRIRTTGGGNWAIEKRSGLSCEASCCRQNRCEKIGPNHSRGR